MHCISVKEQCDRDYFHMLGFFFLFFFLDMAICPDVDNYANDLGYFNFIIINSV